MFQINKIYVSRFFKVLIYRLLIYNYNVNLVDIFKNNQSQIPRTERDHRAICPYLANAVFKVESPFVVTNKIPKKTADSFIILL